MSLDYDSVETVKMECKFCGRETDKINGICDYCEPFLCEVCRSRLSRGYCAVCGRLVCDDDSKLVGFARVCVECLQNDPRLNDYDYLQGIIFNKATRIAYRTKQRFNEILEIGAPPRSEHIYVHIGLDDFDSPYGLCTTYAAAHILRMIKETFEAELLDYPLLIRLNPNIPLKTRGNAGVAIRIIIEKDSFSDLLESILRQVEDLSHAFFRKTQPALAIYATEKYVIDSIINIVYEEALRSVITPKILLRKLRNLKMGHLLVFSPMSTIPRGIVGAVASIGAILDDYTFELLAYRLERNIGGKRQIDEASVLKMNEKMFPLTFGNVDGQKILIAPKGPDPVLLGIRGETPEAVFEAFRMIEHEEIEFWCMFRSNQATSAHIRSIRHVEDAHPYETIMINCEVISARREDDRVFLRAHANGGYVEGVAYRLQRGLQSKILKLKPGDIIKLVIAVFSKTKDTIAGNIEEFIPIQLVPEIIKRNPRCPRCCARLKKKSKDMLYCKKCGLRIKGDFKITLRIPRHELRIGKRYLASPRAHRHLTMPNERIYFRSLKITGKVSAYLVDPVLAKEKNLPLKRIREIKEPKIL